MLHAPFTTPDRVSHADARRNYGENRYRMVGKIDERVFVVVYTVRHDTIRIISARKANQREIKYYENCTRED
jgi:uncharacterized DUF497 family protein